MTTPELRAIAAVAFQSAAHAIREGVTTDQAVTRVAKAIGPWVAHATEAST